MGSWKSLPRSCQLAAFLRMNLTPPSLKPCSAFPQAYTVRQARKLSRPTRFSANRFKHAPHGLGDEVRAAIRRENVKIAREARESASRRSSPHHGWLNRPAWPRRVVPSSRAWRDSRRIPRAGSRSRKSAASIPTFINFFIEEILLAVDAIRFLLRFAHRCSTHIFSKKAPRTAISERKRGRATQSKKRSGHRRELHSRSRSPLSRLTPPTPLEVDDLPHQHHAECGFAPARRRSHRVSQIFTWNISPSSLAKLHHLGITFSAVAAAPHHRAHSAQWPNAVRIFRPAKSTQRTTPSKLLLQNQRQSFQREPKAQILEKTPDQGNLRSASRSIRQRTFARPRHRTGRG